MCEQNNLTPYIAYQTLKYECRCARDIVEVSIEICRVDELTFWPRRSRKGEQTVKLRDEQRSGQKRTTEKV